MKKATIGFLLGVLVIGGGILFWITLNSQPGSPLLGRSSQEIPLVSPRPADQTTPFPLGSLSEPKRQSKSQTSRSLSELWPDSSRMRSEAQVNPHVPSQAFREFADEVGKRMELSFSNEKKASQLFKDLNECAHAESLMSSVQAYCLLNAERLSQRYSSLNEAYQRAWNEADPSVKRQLKQLERFRSQ